MAKKKSNIGKILLALVIVLIIGFAAGLYVNATPTESPIINEIRDVVPKSTNTSEFVIPAAHEFVPANISIEGSRVSLKNGCYVLSFQVTDDQAFSIQNAIAGTMTSRPLTHDILRDLMDDFDIHILGVRIEKYGEEIYYARMFVQQGGKILDMDLRPSDAIAMSLKTKNTLYINQTMLKEHGDNICIGGG